MRSTCYALHGFERDTAELGNRNLTAELENVILGISPTSPCRIVLAKFGIQARLPIVTYAR